MTVSKQGIRVNVYRGKYESTNGGQSSDADSFTVVGVVRGWPSGNASVTEIPEDTQVFVPTDEAPAALLVASNLRGAPPHLVPLVDWERAQGQAGPMHGGNKADSPDARWGKLVRSFMPAGVWVSTVDIHDRVETWKQYEALSQ